MTLQSYNHSVAVAEVFATIYYMNFYEIKGSKNKKIKKLWQEINSTNQF